jgi:hypothetical protein
LPTSGTLRITSEHYGNYDPINGTAYTLEPHQNDTWSTTLTIARMDNAKDDSSSIIYRVENNNPNVDSNIELNLGTTRIANGLFQTGDLSVYNGTSWVSGIAFRRGSTGTGDQILNLLISEMLGLHASPIQRFNGEMFNDAMVENRLAFDGARYLNLGGTFTARNGHFSADWFLIDYDAASVGTLDAERQPVSGLVSGGSNVGNYDGVIEVGRIAGMSVDATQEKIGPYEQTATGGRINGTANVTGATTLSSTLGVTGATTMNAATINGAATLNSKTFVNGSWNSNIVDVTAEPSSVYKVRDNDYILFVTWSGGNGTFEIELPAVDASAGRMIRIKTDSTISNSTALSIVPDAGDEGVLIDGEGSSSMTRSYDGATYLCHNGDWWVIQKKDK